MAFFVAIISVHSLDATTDGLLKLAGATPLQARWVSTPAISILLVATQAAYPAHHSFSLLDHLISCHLCT